MMKLERVKGIAAPLSTANMDTDQIIPKQFLKTLERAGLGRGLFYDLRFEANGTRRADFVLNHPPFDASSILIAGDNFGCGSSREHAPWALTDFGIRCVISTSFADIFYNNCLQNGLLPAIVSKRDLQDLILEATGGQFLVDLPEQAILAPSGKKVAFTIEADSKEKLLTGLDAIGQTLEEVAAIERFEQHRRAKWPWLEPARTSRV